MARKAKKAAASLVIQTAVEVTIKLIIPVTEGSEVAEINKSVEQINAGTFSTYELIDNNYIKSEKAKAKLIQLTDKIPENIVEEDE